jgi:hypothetical protein
MPITIDPANKRLILDSASVTAQAIYVAWVDWLTLSDNAKYLPAFTTAGGDDLGGGLFIPGYYFLENGWRVRPMESNHNLTITGNLFVRGGGVPVVSTLGTYQVNVNYTVPVQAQGIATSGSSGPSAPDIAAAVRSELAVEMARLLDLAKINGLVVGVDAVVTPSTRVAGDVSQIISESAGAVTVARV